MNGDALQRIAVAVTPAVMVSACGLIALGLDNQASRTSARLRDLARELRGLAAGSARAAPLRRQIAVMARRHGIMARALLLDYGAIFAFAATSLLSLVQGFAAMPPEVPLGTFCFGVLMLCGTATFAIASLYLSRAALQIEEQDVLAAPSPAAAR